MYHQKLMMRKLCFRHFHELKNMTVYQLIVKKNCKIVCYVTTIYCDENYDPSALEVISSGANCQKIKLYYENIHLRTEITGDLCEVYDKTVK